MVGVSPQPAQTLALILGASTYRQAPKLAQGRAFYNSAQDFSEYLGSPNGLALPQSNINWLFDDSRSSGELLREVGDFLEGGGVPDAHAGTQDLIVYYVGHGLFWGSEQSYCLAIRATRERSEGPTSIRVSDLASVINTHARFRRKFLILDCCFSASAYKEFQSGPLQIGRVKLMEELPKRGTTLLCSASAQDASLAPAGLSRTMFTDGLLRVLGKGHPDLGPRLSLNELGDLIKGDLRVAHPDSWVRPEVHSPDQREGDIGGVPLFPNFAYVSRRDVKVEKLVVQMAPKKVGLRTRGKVKARARKDGDPVRAPSATRKRREEAVSHPTWDAEVRSQSPPDKPRDSADGLNDNKVAAGEEKARDELAAWQKAEGAEEAKASQEREAIQARERREAERLAIVRHDEERETYDNDRGKIQRNVVAALLALLIVFILVRVLWN